MHKRLSRIFILFLPLSLLVLLPACGGHKKIVTLQSKTERRLKRSEDAIAFATSTFGTELKLIGTVYDQTEPLTDDEEATLAKCIKKLIIIKYEESRSKLHNLGFFDIFTDRIKLRSDVLYPYLAFVENIDISIKKLEKAQKTPSTSPLMLKISELIAKLSHLKNFVEKAFVDQLIQERMQAG